MNHLFKVPVIIFLIISSILSFNSCEKKPTPPVVTTASVSAITQTSATTGGNVTSDGGAEVTIRGVVCGTASNPTISGAKTSDGKGTGSFTSIMTGLQPGTRYYVRAYASNIEATAYGNEVSFTTSQLPAAGEWIISTDFGTLIFTVDASGTKITTMDYQFSNWECGPATISGGITITRETGWPIIDGGFSISNAWGGFYPYDHTMTVVGTYEATNQKFSGTWTHDSYGTICSGTWEAIAPK